MFKTIVGIFSVALFSACSWLFGSIQALEKENVSLRTELQHIQVDVTQLEAQVGR